MKHCPFCQTGIPQPIELSELDLRICPDCLATFLPSSQFAALRRNVFTETRRHWLHVLKERGSRCPTPESLCCLDHGSPLSQGEIPDYGYPGAYPTCCDVQHLPPSLMIRILEFGLAMEQNQHRTQSQRKRNGIARLLGGWLYKLVEKPNLDDGLDTMQYNFKFRDVLGPIPGEEEQP